MTIAQTVELLVLAAIWGASFLFMRVAAPEFGPVPSMFLRVLIGAAFLLAIVLARREARKLAEHRSPLLVVGIINSALPFVLFAYATLAITAGLTSILNATTPFWGAAVAYVWLKDKLTLGKVLGIIVGISGVIVLAWGKASFKPGGSGFAIVAGVTAAFSYGVAASYAKRFLSGVPPLINAAGSQLSATLVLAPLAWWLWPATSISTAAWFSVIALGVFCTGVAYILYFRLIASVGPAKAISVTFLIPFFGVLWGALFLHEPITMQLIIGGLVVLLGTALVTGLITVKQSTNQR